MPTTMQLLDDIQIHSWPTEAPAPVADTNKQDANRFVLTTLLTVYEPIRPRLPRERVISYAQLLNDYAWWVLMQLACRRGWIAAGYKTQAEVVADATRVQSELDAPWVSEATSKYFDVGRLAAYIARHYTHNAAILQRPLQEDADGWERHFHSGLPFVKLALRDLDDLQGPDAVKISGRLDEMKKAMHWDIEARSRQNELAVDYGVKL